MNRVALSNPAVIRTPLHESLDSTNLTERVCAKQTSYYFTIKMYFVLPYQNNNRDFSKQSLYCISFCMKSFNPNSFLSESLTHARKMEVGICEGRGLDGGGDEEREVWEDRNRKGGGGCKKFVESCFVFAGVAITIHIRGRLLLSCSRYCIESAHGRGRRLRRFSSWRPSSSLPGQGAAGGGVARFLVLLFAHSRKSFRNPKLVTKAEEKDTHPSYKRFLFVVQWVCLFRIELLCYVRPRNQSGFISYYGY